MNMKTFLFFSFAIAVSIAPLLAQETVKEKAADAWGATKQTAKNVGHTLKRGTKKVANTVVEAVTPDADARSVNVKLTAGSINMPKKLPAGKTAFVVTNTSNEKLTFEVSDAASEQRLAAALDPKEKKTYQVSLTPGTYRAACIIKGAETHEVNVDLTVH
jgi:hypothetical protein